MPVQRIMFKIAEQLGRKDIQARAKNRRGMGMVSLQQYEAAIGPIKTATAQWRAWATPLYLCCSIADMAVLSFRLGDIPPITDLALSSI